MKKLKTVVSKEPILPSLFLVIAFVIFLIPYSYLGNSANYLFVLFPLFFILLTGKIKKPTTNIIIILIFFSLQFFLATFYQHDLVEFFDKRLMSFVIFMTVFSYLFIDINKKQIDAFKIAIVLIIFCLTISKFVKFYIYTLEGQINFKYFLGSSRYGFVYIFAFWIVFFYKTINKLSYFLKILLILLILLGIFLTYSRTTIIAISCTLILYFLNNIYSIKKKIFSKFIFISIFVGVFIYVIIFLKDNFSGNIFHVYEHTVLPYFTNYNFDDILNNFNNSMTSEGFRIQIWNKISNYILLRPVISSGFLGCWIMYDDNQCSAHSQFFDVFFRVGFIGFFFYIVILTQIYKNLQQHHTDLYYSFVGIIIYGFFHETFKLSQGSFILAFLLGMTYSSKRTNLVNQKVN